MIGGRKCADSWELVQKIEIQTMCWEEGRNVSENRISGCCGGTLGWAVIGLRGGGSGGGSVDEN